MLKFLRRTSCAVLLLGLPLVSQAIPFAYNPYRAANCIDIIDVATNTSTSCAIAPGGTVTALELLPSGTDLFVALEGSTALKRYRYSGAQQSATVAGTDIVLPAVPQVLLASADSQTLWAGLVGSNVLQKINMADGTIATVDVGFVPGVLAISPDGSRLYVAERNGTRLVMLDLTATTITVPSAINLVGAASAMVVSSGGSTLYVAVPGSNVISVRNATTGQETGTISAPGIQSLVLDGSRLFGGAADSIRVWNSSTLVEGTALPFAGTPRWLGISENTGAETEASLYAITTTGAWASITTTADTTVLPPAPGHLVGPYRSVIEFRSATVQESEAIGTSQNVVIRRLGDATGSLNVHFNTYDLGTSNYYAHEGKDYVALAADYAFAPGDVYIRPPVQIINDQYYGLQETFGLQLTVPDTSGYVRLGANILGVYVIDNDDKDPRDRGGCALGDGTADPLLPLLVIGAGVAALRRRRSHR